MVEQVGHWLKEHNSSTLEGLISDGGCQMGFSTAIGSNEEEPAFRLLCECQRCFVSLLYSGNTCIECLKILVTKGIQIRHFTQLLTSFGSSFGLFALASNSLTEVGVSKGDISTEIPCSLTAWANSFGWQSSHW